MSAALAGRDEPTLIVQADRGVAFGRVVEVMEAARSGGAQDISFLVEPHRGAMNRKGVLLFPAALGVSAAAHLLLLFLWPYSPARPAQQPPEPIPVRLLEAPRPAQRPAPPPPAAPRRRPRVPSPRLLRPCNPFHRARRLPPSPSQSPEPEVAGIPARAGAAGNQLRARRCRTSDRVLSPRPQVRKRDPAAKHQPCLPPRLRPPRLCCPACAARIVEKIRYPALGAGQRLERHGAAGAAPG